MTMAGGSDALLVAIHPYANVGLDSSQQVA